MPEITRNATREGCHQNAPPGTLRIVRNEQVLGNVPMSDHAVEEDGQREKRHQGQRAREAVNAVRTVGRIDRNPYQNYSCNCKHSLRHIPYKSAKAYAQLEQELQREPKIEEVARALGLLELGLDKDVTDLSGGQRTKVLLGKLLLEKPDILLLDEPTNYLDKEHITWLTRYLQEYENAFILISHDRHFLDECIDHILVINKNNIEIQKGSLLHLHFVTDDINQIIICKVEHDEVLS